MEIDLKKLRNLLSKQRDEIERAVKGTGFLARTVIGVGTFLLDNEGDVALLSAKQLATFEKFLKPLMGRPLQ
ncbi:MAG TPA: hypothetical protein HPP97_04390 [Desulfuromonadales bacterium]|nr:hypothetical protein [Desulfuromonadales bacterium]